MRFLNPFNRSPKKRMTAKTTRRGGGKRKVKASTRRRARSGINWRLVRRAVPAGAVLAMAGGLVWLYQDGWFGRQAEALQQAALDGTAGLGLRIEEVLVARAPTAMRFSPVSASPSTARSSPSIRKPPAPSWRPCPGSARPASSASCRAPSISASPSANRWRCGRSRA